MWMNKEHFLRMMSTQYSLEINKPGCHDWNITVWGTEWAHAIWLRVVSVSGIFFKKLKYSWFTVFPGIQQSDSVFQILFHYR